QLLHELFHWPDATRTDIFLALVHQASEVDEMYEPLIPFCCQHDDRRLAALGNDDGPTGPLSLFEQLAWGPFKVGHGLDVLGQIDGHGCILHRLAVILLSDVARMPSEPMIPLSRSGNQPRFLHDILKLQLIEKPTAFGY